MSELKQLKLLADYNQLMNQRMLDAAAQLSEDDLHKDCGAFFKSVIGTLNHILVGDIIWLKRFANHPSSSSSLDYLNSLEKPETLRSILFNDLDELKVERENIDRTIIAWINELSEADLCSSLSYNNMAGDTFEKQYASLIHHLFLHQVHHRGQVTTLLSQFGIDFGDTDILEII